MRVLVVQAGRERLAVPALAVCEVVPAVTLSPAAGAPPFVEGLARYRGSVIPVIDLERWATGTPCPERLSARLVVVEVPDGGAVRRLGLLVGQVDDLTDLDPPRAGDYHPPALSGQPDLGPLVESKALQAVVRVPDLAGLARLAFGGRGDP